MRLTACYFRQKQHYFYRSLSYLHIVILSKIIIIVSIIAIVTIPTIIKVCYCYVIQDESSVIITLVKYQFEHDDCQYRV